MAALPAPPSSSIHPATNDYYPDSIPDAYRHYGAMAGLNGKLVFLVEDGVNGKEPWVSDDLGGTFLLKNIASGSTNGLYWAYSGYTQNATLARAGGRILSADDGSTGRELWSTDGTSVDGAAQGTSMRVPRQRAFHLTRATVAGVDRVLFHATTASEGGELWQSDGTAAGTTLLKDCRPGTGSGSPSCHCHRLHSGFPAYFVASDPVAGGELFTTDGTTAGTHLTGDANTTRADEVDSIGFLTSWGDILFSGYDGDDVVLMVSDGTFAGTHELGPVRLGSPVEMDGKVTSQLLILWP